eukprot:2320689-Pyramimonas_sp.AAC.1
MLIRLHPGHADIHLARCDASGANRAGEGSEARSTEAHGAKPHLVRSSAHLPGVLARLEFALVYPDRMGRNVLRKVRASLSPAFYLNEPIIPPCARHTQPGSTRSRAGFKRCYATQTLKAS